MNADRLLAHFEKISDAPNAVDRLRRFVLDLAVRGKLVEQDERESAEPSEAPAADQPFPLPPNWSCVALGGAIRMINGRAFKPVDWLSKGLPIVRIQNLNNESAPFNCCDPKSVDEKHIIDSGTFLISWSGTPGTSFGAFIWQRGKAALNQHIFKCLPTGAEYHNRFLQLAVNGRLDEMIAKAHGGVGLQHITKGKLAALALPLPPLAEQKRIVEKVDELMKLCDRLEASQSQRESRRDRLVVSSLNRIGNPSDSEPDQFKNDVKFHLGNLNRLCTKPEHIKEIRKSILNMAVRGKLVPQDERESRPPRSLQLCEDADCDQRENSRYFTTEDARHPIPPSWIWTRLGMIGDWGSGTTPSRGKAEYFGGTISWFKSGELNDNPCLFGSEERVTEMALEHCSLRRNQPGDVLFAMYGATIGKLAILAEEAVTNQAVVACTPRGEVNNRYLFLFLLSQRERFRMASEGGAQPNVSKAKVVRCPIPLPPLAEQKRIVEKVDELMAICDQLENQLETHKEVSKQLLESLLHEALEEAA